VRSIEARRQPQNLPRSGGIRTRVPDAEIAAVRDASFSSAIRGYDREEVDRYVSRVNNLIAELQITAAPESAIKAALEEVRSEHRALLEEGRKVAEETTTRSRARADDRIQEADREADNLRDAASAEAREIRAAAEAEAREIREAAERDAQVIRDAADARVRELETQVERMLDRRDRVIEELRDLAANLHGVAKAKGSDPASAPEPVQTEPSG
jgi:DivIVA domain-containing protein